LPVLLKLILNCRVLSVTRRSFINYLKIFSEVSHWELNLVERDNNELVPDFGTIVLVLASKNPFKFHEV
jgi:hypothetical protein